MKDLSFLRYFLGIDVAYPSHGYLMSQQKYIADLFDHTALSDPNVSTSSSIFTPMELHLKLRRMMVLLYHNLHGTWSGWILSFILLLLARIFIRLFMSSVNLLVLPPRLIMQHYFVCFVIFDTPSVTHCSTVLIPHFLFGLILMLDGLMISTHVAPPQASAFS